MIEIVCWFYFFCRSAACILSLSARLPGFTARAWGSTLQKNMIDNDGNRTATYDAVRHATDEMKAFTDVYGGYGTIKAEKR